MIIGIDPSSRCTGYAAMSDRDTIVAAGTVKPIASMSTPFDRIRSVVDQLEAVMTTRFADGDTRVICELPSGRHGQASRLGGVSSVMTYAMSVGMIAQMLRNLVGDDRFCVVDEQSWTRRVSKDRRRAGIVAAFPAYASVCAADSGGDVSDAIGLCQWWYARQVLARATSVV